MTALPKEFLTNTHPRARRGRRSFPSHSQAFPVEVANASNQPSFGQSDNLPPSILPQTPLPTSLQFLLRFQQATSVFTLGLVGIALGVYGWTVYTPRAWSQEFHKLLTLQRYERQLITNNESIKHQLAEQATKPGSGLVKAMPQQNIFLAASPNSLSLSKAKPVKAQSPLIISKEPIAY